MGTSRGQAAAEGQGDEVFWRVCGCLDSLDGLGERLELIETLSCSSDPSWLNPKPRVTAGGVPLGGRSLCAPLVKALGGSTPVTPSCPPPEREQLGVRGKGPFGAAGAGKESLSPPDPAWGHGDRVGVTGAGGWRLQCPPAPLGGADELYIYT